MQKGSLIGFPVVNIKACINDGAAHSVDSSDTAFKIAGRMALRQAYGKAKPVVLEPIMKVSVETPEEFSGPVMGGINRRRGQITGNTTHRGFTVIDSEVPLAEMFGYASDLRSSTQGRADFTMEFAKYAAVPNEVQKELMKKYEDRAVKVSGG